MKLIHTQKQGFTLIELMVVVSIIAILSVVGVAVYSEISSKARDAKRKSDIKAIATAIEIKYDTVNKKYRCPIDPAKAFSGGVVPTDPMNGEKSCKQDSSTTANPRTTCYYCIGGNTLSGCGDGSFGRLTNTTNFLVYPQCVFTSGNRICANLEDGTAYCQALSQ